jgi:hypothetical protein
MRVPQIIKTALLASSMSALCASPAAATHSWGGYHWAHATTLKIRLADNVSPAWDTYLAGASVDWTKSIPIDTTVIIGTRSPYSCRPTYGRVEVCSYRYGYTGWLGIAQIWLSSGHIVQGTVEVNDSYFASGKYNTPAWRRMVMCQEVGHIFGLDHQDENKANLNLGSCMDYTSDASGKLGTNGTLSNEHPNAHDYDQLRLMYTHLDSWQLSSTRPTITLSAPEVGQLEAARAPVPSLGDLMLAPREWGVAVAADRKGRGRVFVRRLPGAAVVTTFVMWADPEDR